MLFYLDIETEPERNLARFALTDSGHRQLGSHQVRLRDHPPSLWEGLFDTRAYTMRYARNLVLAKAHAPASAEDLLNRLGVFLGSEVLGPRITHHLARGIHSRTLVVRLPDTSRNLLAAAFARVPWEIARPAASQPPLMARNLVVRAVTAEMQAAEPDVAITLEPGEEVRVLLVFALAPDSVPLALRLERERLLDLFYDDIISGHSVTVDVLCHGVTRTTLADRIRSAGGYHVVHWSGHGHQDVLEIGTDDGKQELLRGEELVEIFTMAGGFLPRLVFLSACLSGSPVGMNDWASLRAMLGGRCLADSAVEGNLCHLLERRKGFTSTALELLGAGIPQVVAMRYAVSDAYARRVARRFYRHFLAEKAHHPADTALALARAELLRDQRPGEHNVVDHATPLIFGEQRIRIVPKPGRGGQADRRRPAPQPLLPEWASDLDPHPGFVGRGRELTRLALEWLPHSGPPAALIQGLAGIGKTALAAEAINLWHGRFDHVLAFQARPTALVPDSFYSSLHLRLLRASRSYEELCAERPGRAVFIRPDHRWIHGDDRFQVLHDNLISLFLNERILLVLDGFEANLESSDEAQGYLCQNPRWDQLLRTLVRRLAGSGSRLLVTSRHRLQALADGNKTLGISLAPLNGAEAALMLSSHKTLTLYEQYAAAAESNGDWLDLALICHNWANTLSDAGLLDQARASYQRSVAASRRASGPVAAGGVYQSRLEILRIDLLQGHPDDVLEQLGQVMDELRDWWRQQRRLAALPDGLDPGLFINCLGCAFGIAAKANAALEHWPECLGYLDQLESLERDMGASELAIASTRYNRYEPLLRLGRLDDAQRLLEQCLQVFAEHDDQKRQASVLLGLADLWDKRSDVDQAVALARRATWLLNQLDLPEQRAVAHNNLANYLFNAGDGDEAAAHALASVGYSLVAGNRRGVDYNLHNIAVRIIRAARAKGNYRLPAIDELLRRPDFATLGRFLASRGVEAPELQTEIAAGLETLYKVGEESST